MQGAEAAPDNLHFEDLHTTQGLKVGEFGRYGASRGGPHLTKRGPARGPARRSGIVAQTDGGKVGHLGLVAPTCPWVTLSIGREAHGGARCL